jgi:hypothetical protein
VFLRGPLRIPRTLRVGRKILAVDSGIRAAAVDTYANAVIDLAKTLRASVRSQTTTARLGRHPSPGVGSATSQDRPEENVAGHFAAARRVEAPATRRFEVVILTTSDAKLAQLTRGRLRIIGPMAHNEYNCPQTRFTATKNRTSHIDDTTPQPG